MKKWREIGFLGFPEKPDLKFFLLNPPLANTELTKNIGKIIPADLKKIEDRQTDRHPIFYLTNIPPKLSFFL